ncbi:tigger transposable element-derived protein 4-like [Saccostrea echinata]|uniref:tigger transposable element-derived protein 4-like n=1 Tax=Saccostrea echinata TaxID=191078 RepID=UPI002A840198|nr:tigger transposable element-derived protein 4-like [Saccostrea echinata]
MDQGIIQSLKVQYRKRVLLKYINAIDKGQTPTISILDALHLLSQAWDNVTVSTISNCFRHAGFATQNDNATPDEDEDFDIEYSIPLATLRAHGLNPEMLQAFTTIDDEIETCADLSDNDIVEEVLMKKTTEPMNESETTDDPSEPLIQPPNSEDTEAACELVRQYLVCRENSQDILRHMNVILDTVRRNNILKKSVQQSRITTFFQKK